MIFQRFVEEVFAVIRSYQEAAATTCRIQNVRARLPDAERVYHVNNVFAGVVLTEFMPFFGADEFLKGVAKDVCGNLFEVKPINGSDYLVPGFHRVGPRQCTESSPFLFFW